MEHQLAKKRMTVGEPFPICCPTVPVPLTVGSENLGACPPTCGIPDSPLDPMEVNSPTPRAAARTHPTRRNLLRGRCGRPCGKSSDAGKITGSCSERSKPITSRLQLDAETGIAVSVLTTPETNTSLQYGGEFSTVWGFCWAGGPHGLGTFVISEGENERSELRRVVVCGSTTMLNVWESAG